MTKRNTTAPVHIGLCTILAYCPLQPLNSDKEGKKKDKNKEKKEKGKAQKLDKDFN